MLNLSGSLGDSELSSFAVKKNMKRFWFTRKTEYMALCAFFLKPQ